MKVLLLEDNRIDARVFEALLRRSGLEPVELLTAERLAEAVDMVRQQTFDLAIVDLGLPDSQGLGSLLAMRSAAPTLPIVVLTGESEEQLALQSLQSGAQDYLLKDDLRGLRLGQTIRFAIQRKQAEETMRSRDRETSHVNKMEAIGQLAAGIAHEINTPMQYIGDNVKFLGESVGELRSLLNAAVAMVAAAKSDQPSQSAAVTALVAATEAVDVAYLPPEIPRALSECAQGVDRVSRIVRAMKEFSHPGTRENKDLNVGHAVECALTVCRNEWKYVAEVVTEIPNDLPALHCNPGEINQVLLNLMVNAAHAIAERVGNGGEKGRITVGAFIVDGDMEIRVSDTGTGIPDHVLARMYEPFFTTKEVGKGTGQGLAVVYKVVQNHSGSIACDTTVGVGTTFRIRLPLTGTTANPVDTAAHDSLEVCK